MLKPFADDIWIADGGNVGVARFQYPTRMAIIRLSRGELFIWSPTKLTDSLQTAVNALGHVSHIVAPNSLHHLYLPEWARAYPQAALYAPPGLREKRKDIAFTTELTDKPNPDWAAEVDQVLMRGNLMTTEVVFFHKKSCTALFTDLVQQIPADLLPGWRGTVAKLDLMVGAEPQVPRKFRLAFIGRRAARHALARVLAWPTEKVLMAHGTPIEKDGRAFLRRAFRWLGG
jgi:hypothetical protein